MHEIFPQTAARVAQWSEQPEVLGVLLVGSKSREHDDELSDDDLEVLLTDEAFALRAPRDCGEFLFEGDDEDRGRLIYDTQYTTFSDLQQKRYSPLDLDRWPYERARVLFDRYGNVATTVAEVGRMDAEFRHMRLLYSTLNVAIAVGRVDKTVKRGHEAAVRMIVDRGAKSLSRLLFALEWRWVALDHWLENELATLEDPTKAVPQLLEALKTGNHLPLWGALKGLEDLLASEGVPRPAGRNDLFFELIHPSRNAERAIHGVY
jgi:hypothetical protein